MRFTFIVQGEGRGHLTQAISLAGMLHRNGHQVIEVLVGKGKLREIPDFFYKRMSVPVRIYDAPSFIFKKNKKHIDLLKTLAHNLNPHKLRKFGKSIEFIYQRIKLHKPDIVVNFYEILPGFVNLRFKINIPFINIGHQYLLKHPDFQFGKDDSQNMMLLRLHTFLSSIGATKLLALSFYPMKKCASEKLMVMPPLLRKEVFTLQPAAENFILGYVVNHGYLEEILRWHKSFPEIKLHFFWDKHNAPEEWVVDETLTLHRINDAKFLRYMKDCRGYVTTAGFESVCEALYMNKPLMLIPAHVEQEINAFDAASVNGGVVSDNFDLSRLLKYIEGKRTFDHRKFKEWVLLAETLFIKELTEISEG